MPSTADGLGSAGEPDLDAASSTPLHPAAREVLPGRARPGVRRPATPALRRPRRPPAARQRPRGHGRRPRRTTRRGVLHRDRHRRRASRAARACVRGSRRGDLVVHSAVEHSSVLHAVRWGARGVAVAVDSPGSRRPRRPAGAAGRPEVAVVALQTANHEVGTLQPVGSSSCRATSRSSPTPARRWGASRCPTAGRSRPARPTSGADRPASACCWCARARGGATRSRPTTASTSAPPASRTCRPSWPPPRRSRPWSPSATRSTLASTR